MRELALSIPSFGRVEAPNMISVGGVGQGGALENILGFLVNLIFFFAIILGLGMIIWAGIKWTMSQGDKQKIEGVKSHLFYALVGFTVIALSFFIVNFIGGFFNVKLFGR